VKKSSKWQDNKMKIIAMIQYLGHAIHAAGSVVYRAVEFELTPEQSKKLTLLNDEAYGGFAVSESVLSESNRKIETADAAEEIKANDGEKPNIAVQLLEKSRDNLVQHYAIRGYCDEKLLKDITEYLKTPMEKTKVWDASGYDALCQEFMVKLEAAKNKAFAMGAAKEREECAKICEEAVNRVSPVGFLDEERRQSGINTCLHLAKTIRARV
jgi:hypothetical protein